MEREQFRLLVLLKHPHFKHASLQRSWPVVGCSLVTCFFLWLFYWCQLAPGPLIPFGVPGPRHSKEIAARPQIELHPENHVYREPATQYLDWRVSKGYRRPDGVLKQVYLINDLFPGPTVEARSGDTLIISVTNDLPDESIALHWHGLHVANDMEGAVGVSQCPIAPGNQFVYKLTISSGQSGTFWYHSHSGVSRADGLYGGLVVHVPASRSAVRGLAPALQEKDYYSYDKEALFLIGDWYHRAARDVLDWYIDPGNFGNEPVPDSLLINGVGHFDCMMAVPARPMDCVVQPSIVSLVDFDAQSTVRIRVVNTGALAGFSFLFDHHTVQLIQVDSVDVGCPKDLSAEEDINSVGILYPGQRMDFILRPRPNPGYQASMGIQLDQDCFKYANPALNPDQTFPIGYRGHIPQNTKNGSTVNVNRLNIQEVPSPPSILEAMPPRAKQTHVVYTKIQKMARYSNRPFGYFNQTTWRPQEDPPIPLASLPRKQWDSNQLAISTGPTAVWIDLIVNNLDEGSHPFHLHGHHFYILAVHQSEYGWGSYNPFVDRYPPHLSPDAYLNLQRNNINDLNSSSTGTVSDLYSTSRAALRDTVQIPSRGYAVLRFRADNPGVWLFHCHILWHSVTGMAMLIDVQGDPEGLAAHETGSFAHEGASCRTD